MLRQMDKCGKNLYTALIWRFHPGTLEWYPNPCFGGLTPIDPHFDTILRGIFQGYLPNFTDSLMCWSCQFYILLSNSQSVMAKAVQCGQNRRSGWNAKRLWPQKSWKKLPPTKLVFQPIRIILGNIRFFLRKRILRSNDCNNLDDSIEHDVCYQTSNWLLCTDMIQMWLRGIRMTQDLPMTFCEIHPSSTFLEGNKFQHQTYWASLQMSSTETRQKSLPAYTVKIFQDLLLPAIGCIEKLS